MRMTSRPVAVVVTIVAWLASAGAMAQSQRAARTDDADVNAAGKRYNIASILEKFGRARVIVQYRNVQSVDSPFANLPFAHERFAAALGVPAAAANAKPIGTSRLVS